MPTPPRQTAHFECSSALLADVARLRGRAECHRPAAPTHFRALLFGLVGYVLVASCGCRSVRDNQIDILERELRSQEDYIYELEDYVVEYSDKLRQCRCNHPGESVIYSESSTSQPAKSHQLKKARRPAKKKEADQADDDERPILDDSDSMEPFDDEPSLQDTIIPEELEIPPLKITEPLGRSEPSDPFSQVTQAAHEQEVQTPAEVLFIPDPAQYIVEAEIEQIGGGEFTDDLFRDASDGFAGGAARDSAADPAAEFEDNAEFENVDHEPMVADRTAERLVITQLLRDADGPNSLGSLLAVVEARDLRDEPVDLDGEVSLMVMTAELDSPKRLRRWDFTEEETTTAWQSSELGDGLHLELPLEDSQLPDSALELWVRLVSHDGRKLLTQLPFEPHRLPAIDEARPTEGYLRQEGPLLAVTEDVATDLVVPAEHVKAPPNSSESDDSQFNVLRPAAASHKKKPRWRASIERSNPQSASYSTTARGALGWSAQQTGGGMTRSTAALAVRPANSEQPVPPQKPNWTRQRSSQPSFAR